MLLMAVEYSEYPQGAYCGIIYAFSSSVQELEFLFTAATLSYLFSFPFDNSFHPTPSEPTVAGCASPSACMHPIETPATES
jgi:hypothetical protein